MLKEYFSELLYVCTFFTVALTLSHKRTKGAVKLAVGVLMMCVILLPLVDIIRGFSLDDYLSKLYDEMEYEGNDESVELAFEMGIAAYIAEEYGVSSECVIVGVDGFDMEYLTAERIYVTLSKEAIYLDYKRIESDVGEKFTKGGECEVSLRIG